MNEAMSPAATTYAARWLVGWLLVCLGFTASARPTFDTTTPASFFTNVADRVLRAETADWLAENYSNYTNTFGATTTNAFGVANIPVWVNGAFVYAPSVQRMLQVTANTFEAMSTNAYPAVYRPTFYRDPGSSNVFINGYQLVPSVSSINDPALASPVDVSAIVSGNIANVNSVNVYGVPWIIGARKGFPEFSELNLLSVAQVSRLVRVNRSTLSGLNSAFFTTNQMFIMSISNSVGVSLWNSYDADYVGSSNLTIFVQDTMRMRLTNAENSGEILTGFCCTANISYWPGSAWSLPNIGELHHAGPLHPHSDHGLLHALAGQ